MSDIDNIFVKYHALGNDYLFLDASKFSLPSLESIKRVCHRHFGLGSDGILYGGRSTNGTFTLRIINPDGGEAEISGNGLRIFSYAMFERGHVNMGEDFFVKTSSRLVCCRIVTPDNILSSSDVFIAVDMGEPKFTAHNIPSFLPCGRAIAVNGVTYTYFPVSIGNPHCVIFVEAPSMEETTSAGPIIERCDAFAQKTNVQFAKVIDVNNIAIEIWERGAGYTLASGSSACAVFAVANRLGMCSNAVTIRMSGGSLNVRLSERGTIVQTGPVEKIATCKLAPQFLHAL